MYEWTRKSSADTASWRFRYISIVTKMFIFVFDVYVGLNVLHWRFDIHWNSCVFFLSFLYFFQKVHNHGVTKIMFLRTANDAAKTLFYVNVRRYMYLQTETPRLKSAECGISSRSALFAKTKLYIRITLAIIYFKIIACDSSTYIMYGTINWSTKGYPHAFSWEIIRSVRRRGLRKYQRMLSS